MIPTPFVSLRSTFPPDRGNRPHRPSGGHMGPPLQDGGQVAPSSVICFANATFPPGGRSGAPGSSRPTKGLLPCGGGAPVRTLGRKGETPRLSEQLNLRMPPSVSLRSTAPPQGGSQGRARTVRPRAATWGRPFVVASPISFASACGESSRIPLLRLSPPNPRLSPLGFGGGPKIPNS